MALLLGWCCPALLLAGPPPPPQPPLPAWMVDRAAAYNRGVELYRLGRVSRYESHVSAAVRLLRRSIALAPDHSVAAQAHFYLGASQALLGDVEAARRATAARWSWRRGRRRPGAMTACCTSGSRPGVMRRRPTATAPR